MNTTTKPKIFISFADENKDILESIVKKLDSKLLLVKITDLLLRNKFTPQLPH